MLQNREIAGWGVVAKIGPEPYVFERGFGKRVETILCSAGITVEQAVAMSDDELFRIDNIGRLGMLWIQHRRMGLRTPERAMSATKENTEELIAKRGQCSATTKTGERCQHPVSFWHDANGRCGLHLALSNMQQRGAYTHTEEIDGDGMILAAHLNTGDLFSLRYDGAVYRVLMVSHHGYVTARTKGGRSRVVALNKQVWPRGRESGA